MGRLKFASLGVSSEMWPWTDPQVKSNVVAFTVTFPVPELTGRASNMMGPSNHGCSTGVLPKKGLRMYLKRSQSEYDTLANLDWETLE